MEFEIRAREQKLYLIYGALNDQFMTPDLQKMQFQFLLNRFLKSQGFEQIVYYSVQNQTGKYVLDDESAMNAININRRQSINVAAQTEGNTTPIAKPSRPRIVRPGRGPRSVLTNSEQDQQTSIPAMSDVKVEPACVPDASSKKIVYKQAKVSAIQFRDEAAKMIANNKIKTAIVFTNFRDFASDYDSIFRQYSELFDRWRSYIPPIDGVANENICIFLDGYDRGGSMGVFLDSLPENHGGVFKDLFYNKDSKTPNPSNTLEIGLPEKDEISYLLDYLRIVGDGGRKLQFAEHDRDKIISSIIYWSREREQSAKDTGNLKSIEANLTRYMSSAVKKNDGTVTVNEDQIKLLFASEGSKDSEDPLEELKEMKGWEPVARRIEFILSDFRRRRRQFDSREKLVLEDKNSILSNTNNRIARADLGDRFNYPVPSFVFIGNPGTGKTTVARLIGKILYNAGMLENGVTVECTRQTLVGEYVGKTAIKTHDVISLAQGGVLFLDEAYSLAEGGENDFGKEAIDEIVASLTDPNRNRYSLILAGYPVVMEKMLEMNPGFLSRIGKPNIFATEDFTPDVLQGIFENAIIKENCRLPNDDFGEKELDMTGFFANLYKQRNNDPDYANARTVISIANEVVMNAKDRNPDSISCVRVEDFGIYQQYFAESIKL